MAARSHRNRYRTEPFGKDYGEVVKKAKRFFRNSFDNSFVICQYREIWYTSTTPVGNFEAPPGSETYRFIGGRWVKE